MSQLIFDISELLKNDDIQENQQYDPQHYRIFAQFIDIEYVPSDSSKKYFCKLLIQNLPNFELKVNINDVSTSVPENQVLCHLYMEESTFLQFFINEETKIDLQPGDPVDIQAVTWHEYDDNNTIILESINLRQITIKEVDALRDFILSPEGRCFFNP